MYKWNFRIVEQEYDNGDKMYVLESDKGGQLWTSIYRNPDLEDVRKIKAERELSPAKPMKMRVIE